MTPERYQRVKAVFHEIVELPQSERAAALAVAAGSDTDLRREVETLLAASDTEFLEKPVHVPDDEQDRSGDTIGPWRIERLLARGGMGAVYLATRDDGEFRQEAALKIVKRGMDTDFIVRKFREERQILAGLSHPNIARLLDGGSTEDGVPWFAMEYVRGVAIDRYCEQNGLDIEARLALFRKVCEAVHHAHQNLIVHRDIKPSNILIMETGEPVLLDFGIAKLLDPARDHATATEIRIMTPAYASPEQAAGGAITTATDVYSLGVLLHELLAGTRPVEHQLASTVATDKRIAKRLRGDLDNILAMALQPEPKRRYASARELGQDIADHLANRPVIAYREGVVARTWRAIKRHRVAAGLTTVVAVTLVGGIIATTWQAGIARAERQRAERRFDEVRSLAKHVMFELHDSVAELPGSTKARALLVEQSVRYLESLSADAADNAPLLAELSQAWLRVGDVQGNDRNANLGDRAGAAKSYARALEAAERAHALDGKIREPRLAMAQARDRLGDSRWEHEDLPGAQAQYEAAIPLLRTLVTEDPADRQATRDLANALIDLGDTRATLKADPMPHYREALALGETLVAGDASDAKAIRTLTVVLNKLASRQAKSGDRAGALASYRRALELREAVAAKNPDNAAAQRDVSVSLERIGKLLKEGGDLAGARTYLERGRVIDEKLVAADPSNAQALHDLAADHLRLAELDEALQQWASAKAGYERGLALLLELEKQGKLSKEDAPQLADIRAAIERMAAK